VVRAVPACRPGLRAGPDSRSIGDLVARPSSLSGKSKPNRECAPGRRRSRVAGVAGSQNDQRVCGVVRDLRRWKRTQIKAGRIRKGFCEALSFPMITPSCPVRDAADIISLRILGSTGALGYTI
jgi:hypothetical protein